MKETIMETPSSDYERRKQARLEKLGTNSPKCGICGNSNWRCIEQHHIADHKRDGAMALLCANCHRKVTDDQKDHPPFDPEADTLLDAIGHFLLGLADMLRIAVEKLLTGEKGGRVAELPGGMKATRRRGMLELSAKKGLKKASATSKIPRR